MNEDHPLPDEHIITAVNILAEEIQPDRRDGDTLSAYEDVIEYFEERGMDRDTLIAMGLRLPESD